MWALRQLCREVKASSCHHPEAWTNPGSPAPPPLTCSACQTCSKSVESQVAFAFPGRPGRDVSCRGYRRTAQTPDGFGSKTDSKLHGCECCCAAVRLRWCAEAALLGKVQRALYQFHHFHEVGRTTIAVLEVLKSCKGRYRPTTLCAVGTAFV